MPEDARVRQRQAMARLGLDAMAIVAPENVCWTVGTFIPSQKTVRHRHAVVVVPVEGDPEMIVVNIEKGFAKGHADVAMITAYNEFTEKPMLVLADAIQRRRLRTVGVEARYLSYADYLALERALGGAARLVPIDDVLQQLRMVKSAREVDRLQRAARIAEGAAREGLRAWRPGMTEIDIGGRIAMRSRRAVGAP